MLKDIEKGSWPLLRIMVVKEAHPLLQRYVCGGPVGPLKNIGANRVVPYGAYLDRGDLSG